MVSELDIEGNKKVIWFSKNPYLGTIEVVGSVLLVNGVQQVLQLFKMLYLRCLTNIPDLTLF
ncbi:hypothetical protein DK28_0212695 [Peptococcaceae bacterium SCADC1_2_3]|nr:hypothetical protein DK28_0212695 [Peptococcaceae bacterium SCADC1_2_3]KFI35076.1 hypothetical protein HY00_07835 [Peptococcaceae bacterium SCADC1_2_3]